MQTKIIRSLGSVLRVLWPGEVMTNYLDVHKSVIISSPAGSGKTEKLAQRFIALLKAGVSVERILAVTFTEKAAAEMKQRILKTLKEEDEKLFKKLLEKMSLMRVSTIHSFCGTLLRRFSFEASIDANYRIEDAIDSRIVWEKILYEILMEVGMNRFRGGEEKDGHELLLKSLSEKGFRGLEYLKTTVNNLFEKNPFSLDAEIIHQPSLASHFSLVEELKNWPGARDTIKDYDKFFENGSFEILTLSEKYFLTAAKELRKRPAGSLKHIADYPLWAAKMFLYWKHKNIEECTERAERIRTIFKKCFNKYNEKKALKGVLDFSDLEYIAFRLLADNPEWANILYAFDEKTDHILVDEFQDTNSFQWAIIDRLTEEWRSGMGAKREEGITPTIFLVGDEKQSIYFFRGANVEIFRKARKKLQEWLADEFIYEEVKENFRSRPAIINFTNHVFQKIMIAEENAPSWITQYRPFEARRKDSVDTGRVEIILLNDEAWPVGETKKNEADIIAKRIRSLIGNYQITDRPSSQQRPCTYMDVALLLRKRTHLKKYEEAFRNHGIPFVVVKGIGFYQEPEIAILRALVYFLSNPHDDYNLYILLKSPFFSFKENVIIKATGFEGDSLFSKLKKSGLAEKTVVTLEELLSQSSYTPLGELIEKSLVQTGAWEYFYEAQRRANVKKFVRIVEDMERNGKSLIKVRDFLERIYGRDDEPKANVNT